MKRSILSGRLVSLCFVCLSLFAFALMAQTFYGSIVGTVTDNSGAVVPGAAVTMTNLGTTERRSAVTDSSGNFQFVNLVPARYRVTVEASGFRRATHDQVGVEVQSSVRLDTALQVGDVEQTVEVSVTTPLLQTETTSLGQVVESRRVLEMPSNGRNVLSVVALVPGVIPQAGSLSNPTGINNFSPGNFQIGGGLGNNNATFIDGSPINSFLANLTMMLPSQDAVQEIRVETNNIGPEFGRFSGGVVSMTTRSGNNEFHGTVYDYLRNKLLNANSFFNNSNKIVRPAFTQNQFGGTVGGPVFKDKTFFYFGYEGFRRAQGQPSLSSLATAAMRQGDFSGQGTATGVPVIIYDPLTSCGVLGNPACTPAQSATGGALRQPFPENKIPSFRFDPVAVALQKRVWPLPNTPGQPFTNINNYAINLSIGGDADQIHGRVDQNISEKQRMFGRYARWAYLNHPAEPFNIPGGSATRERVWSQQGVFADTYTFSPTMIGDFRLSALRYVFDRVPSGFGVDLTEIGLPAALNNQYVYRHLPVVTIQNMSSSSSGSIIYQFNDDLSATPNMTIIRGSHTLKIGGEVRRMTNNYVQSQQPAGAFNFNNLFTAANPYATGTSGFGYASFLLGYGSGGNVNSPAAYATTLYYQGYHVADTFQVNRKLTFNYGLRWEPAIPFTERFDRMVVFLPNAESPLAKPTGLPIKGRFGFVKSADSDNRYSRRAHPWLFAPRTGFAYRLTNKTVIRGGYGVFYPPQYDILGGGSIGPLTNIVTEWVSTLDGSLTPANRFSNPFPTGINIPFGRNPAFQDALYGSTVGGDVGNPILTVPGEVERAQYYQQWNFNVQREFLGGTVVEVSYAGSKGTHLQAPVGRNQVSRDVQALGVAALQVQVPNPFYGIVSKGTLAAPTVARGQLLRPFPQYNGVVGGDANRDTIYHAMNVRIQKRFEGGGLISGAYTWSKNIGTKETETFWLESSQSTSPFGAVQDSYNLRGDRAISSFDAAHRLVVSFILDLPFGKGKKFLGGADGVAGKLVSGWGVNGISTFQSGFPLGFFTSTNLTNSFNAFNTYTTFSRPNSTGISPRLEGPAQERIGKWFDTAQFTAPPPTTFGNTARNLADVRTHGIANYDFTLFKNTPIRERMTLQFRMETFNLFNRVQFGRPGNTLGLTTFGVISSQANNPRLVQFSLRLTF